MSTCAFAHILTLDSKLLTEVVSLQEMVSWIYDKSNSLKKQDFERYSSWYYITKV